MEPIETQNLPQPGSIADTVARLLLWSRRAPKGLARVEFTSEFARQRVIESLRAGLAEEGIPFHERELPAHTPAAEIVRQLVEQFKKLEPSVVSLTGFATAFPDDVPLVDSLRVFNFNRENLASPSLRQIWWVTPYFADAFIRAASDLDSWFMVRLCLTEAVRSDGARLEAFVPGTAVSYAQQVGMFPATADRAGLRTFAQPENSYLSLEEARRRSAYLVGRFENALQGQSSVSELLNLLIPAVRVLNEAGAIQEAGTLTDTLLEQMAQAGKPFSVNGANANAASPVSPEEATSLNDIADLYYHQRRYREAEPLYQRALAIREKQLEPDHSATALSLNNLAALYYQQEKYAEAESLLKRALRIWEKTLGPRHSNIAASLSNLATLHCAQGRYTEAEALYKRAWAIAEETLGLEHPDTVIILADYITLLRQMGRTAEAEAVEARMPTQLRQTLKTSMKS